MNSGSQNELTIISTNICYYSIQQLPQIASFLYGVLADVVFFQEANGCLPELLEMLKARYTEYKNASIDLTTHILIRQGRFIPVTEKWPDNFYARVQLPYTECLLLNIHMCEREWDTDCDDCETRYRVQYLERMLKHLGKISKLPTIVAGDFNSISHLNSSSIKTVNSSLTLQREGFTDCWNTVNTNKNTLTYSWPVPLSCIAHDEFLPGQINSQVSARIDYVYVSQDFRTLSCEHMHTVTNWFSDHLAVVSRVQPIIAGDVVAQVTESMSKIENSHVPTLSLKVLTEDCDRCQPTWLLSAGGLTGEKNQYIEIYMLQENKRESMGWFYVDGLCEIDECSLADVLQYQYATFDPHKPVSMDCKWQACLYNEALEELCVSAPTTSVEKKHK